MALLYRSVASFPSMNSFFIYLYLAALLVAQNAVIGNTTQPKINTIEQNMNSHGSNVEEIQALTLSLKDLERDSEWWNGWYIKIAGLTAWIAALLFVFQFVAHRKSEQLRVAQAALIKLKDEKLATNLRDKDLEIATAKKEAGVANDNAGHANERAGKLEQQAAELRSQNLVTESHLTEANRALEAEKATRLELEKSIAPRSFEIKVSNTPNSNFEELKPFAGTKVIFEVLTDAEARRAANEIGNLVGFASWNVVSVKANPDLWFGFFDGVSIVPPGGGFPKSLPYPADPNKIALRQKITKAAESLALCL